MANFMTRLFSGMTLPKVSPMKEMGAAGTVVHGGLVQSVERSAKWTGPEKYREASEIAVNVSIVAASVHHFLNLITHPQWNIKPAEEDNSEAQKYADYVEEVINDMEVTWPRVVRRAGMYRFHGYGIQEWVAKKRDDGQIGLRTIEPRPQHTIERWEVNDEGSVTGVWQRSPQTNQLLGLPRGKIVYLVEDTLSDSPEGLGMFRHLAEPYNRLKAYLDLETRAFERDLRGIPVGRAPITLINQAIKENRITQNEGDALINVMKNFVKMELKKSDTGIVLDSHPYESQANDGLKIAGGTMQWGIELLQGQSAGLPELSHAIDRLQREMARILGTEHLMLGDAGGNRALSADKSRNLYLIANGTLATIAEGLDKDIIDPLWKLNAFPEELKPYFATEDVAFKDVLEVANALQSMATAGAVLDPMDPVVNDVRDLLGVSHAPDPTPMQLEAVGRDDEGEPKTQEDMTEEGLENQRRQMEMTSEFANDNADEDEDEVAAKLLVTGTADPIMRKFIRTGRGLFS